MPKQTREPLSMSMFLSPADYWQAMYEQREEEARLLRAAPPGAPALPVEGEGQPDSVYLVSPVQSEGALSGEAQELIERDATRFQWYFSDKPKGDWLATYLDGVRTGWTIDQWRAAIDAALKEQPQ